MMQNQQLSGGLVATANRPRPGEFAVGSPQSRAAARSLIEERRSHAKLVDLVVRVEGLDAPSFSEWGDNGNSSFTRRSKIPAGISFEQAERIAGVSPVQAKGEYVRLWIDGSVRTVSN